MSTFVIVSQKARADLFAHSAPGASLEPRGVLEHPASAKHDAELVTHSPGSIQSPAGYQPHAAVTRQSPKEHEAERFAREVADALRDARLSDEYRSAVVVAAPQFLGLLRAALDDADREFVVEEIPKNIAGRDIETIEATLSSVLQFDESRPRELVSPEVRSLLN